MIEITTDGNAFSKKISEESKVIIYGAGTVGESIGKLFFKAQIPFDYYLDINATNDQTFLGKKILQPSELKHHYKAKKYLIIISAPDVAGCLREIEREIPNALVLIPPGKGSENDFDCMMSFCRNKLVKQKDFTIFANNCLGGRFYGILGCKMMSPTIDLIIEPKDYVKFCTNIEHYLKQELKFVEYTQWRYGLYHSIGKLDDIFIRFIAYKTFEEAKEKWERRKKRVNLDNVFFLFDDTHFKPTKNEFQAILDIPFGEKLILQRNFAYSQIEHSINTTPGTHPFDKGHLIEDWFDLIGWINREVTY